MPEETAMRSIGDGLAADPLIAAALAARDIDPADLPESESNDEDETEFVANATRWLPAIRASERGDASISWYNPEHIIRYAIDGDGTPGIVTADGLVLPETVVDGLGGRTLDTVLSFPGAERMRILVAVNSSVFPGDVTDLRMTVEPIDGRDKGEEAC